MRNPRRRQPTARPVQSDADRPLAKTGFLPRAAHKSVPAPTQEEFDAWAQHPITEWVAARYEIMALACRDAWSQHSWSAGVADEKLLTELRAKADAYMAFLETTYERYTSINAKS